MTTDLKPAAKQKQDYSEQAISLTQALIKRPSITPEDAGCQQLIADYLSELGFHIEHLPFGSVQNLWATFGEQKPLLVFAGHTDVVPTGPIERWYSDPFTPVLKDGNLFGRGAADMKSGLAAMLTATQYFLQQCDFNPKGSIGFLITSDEEGPAQDGTQKVLQYLAEKNIKVDYCLLGEPSSSQYAGDTVKHGRRGSLSANLKILGKQGHVAYPHLAQNPLHQCLSALAQLTTHVWDQANDDFPATSLQITRIQGGDAKASNVTPGEVYIDFNLRFSTQVTAQMIQAQVAKILDQAELNYELHWTLHGKPFLTKDDYFIENVCKAIKTVTGQKPILSTAGGTSDGRFISPAGIPVVELGVCNHSIHQVNEHVSIGDIKAISQIYYQALQQILDA